jgi:hypothetical protein
VLTDVLEVSRAIEVWWICMWKGLHTMPYMVVW